MQPSSQQNQAGLPVAAQQDHVGVSGTVPEGSATAVTLGMTESIAAQYARQLSAHYAGNPYELSVALADLKAHFQAERYNISPSSAEGS